MIPRFDAWFYEVTGNAPHPWQLELAADEQSRHRLIRIPTGFGKTAGTVLPWLYHRVIRNDTSWPTRMVFCLPMRTLVEQTEGAIKAWLAKAGLTGRVGLHVFMGGSESGPWLRNPEKPAILVGTQDMLLSRALNRGYGSGRAAWPMEFGLLHHDALWTLDEVQLMDVGLATSAQLAAFRDADVARGLERLRPLHTWWMSATLQPRWLATIDRPAHEEAPLSIPAAQRKDGLFAVRKPLLREKEIDGAEALAACAGERHVAGSLTLIMVNRVATALAVYDALIDQLSEGKGKKRALRTDAPELKLVHSRFRGVERSGWAREFLRRDAPLPEAGRIVIATQVVEAGVDISARTLVTELAPWSSLVQRFGRVARYSGEEGSIVVAGAVPASEKLATPYSASALKSADEGLQHLLDREADGSPRSLEAFEEELSKSAPEFLAGLYPYEPLHVLRRRDLDDLFDNSADLSGADLDISRFIRSGDDRDVRVFWRALDGATPVRLDTAPHREELCPVPIGDIREWKHEAFVLDYLDGSWTRRDVKRLVPGMTVMLDAAHGGYTIERGWDGKSKSVEPVPLAAEAIENRFAQATSAEEGEELSIAQWKTIATHGREAEEEARRLCVALGLGTTDVARVLTLAARWHDAGKAHEVFQDAITRAQRDTATMGARRDLAKAPRDAWKRPPYPTRPGFRHELASTLALFELLRRSHPFHAALLGPQRELLAALGISLEPTTTPTNHPLVDEIAALSADEFDLLAWLVCTHHGKVRCVWTSTPHDQEAGHGGIHGVCETDQLPAFALTDAAGHVVEVPPVTLSLATAAMGVGARYGASWGERVAGLLARHGPFKLAYLEALLRAADWSASSLNTEDPLA